MQRRMMRRSKGLLAISLLGCAVAAVLATAGDEPVFVRFLIPDDPDDATLFEYWQRSERDELDAVERVDLGTMLYHRGFPKDAIRMYRRALDLDRQLYEAWFRIGLVHHSQGELNNAAQAYRRCLKKRPGHGWSNFYLGLLEEQRGHARNAMYHYQKAFTHAPELADPEVNPAVMQSTLALGANLITHSQRRLQRALPMHYLQPDRVSAVRARHLPEAGEPTAEEETVSAAGETEMSERAAPPAPTPTSVVVTPTPVPQRPPRSIPVRRAPTPTSQVPNERGPAPGPDAPRPYGGGAPVIEPVSDEARILPFGRLSRDAA